MNRSYRILPVYTGDVSGVCSALYELGGMVVIHDPSGCNSTYNTHDETRWYDRDSLIFITGLSEIDAILGGDEKLVTDVCDAALALRPAFIALVNSPIPFLSGTDFPAVCRMIQDRTGIRTFYVPTNGMHDYVKGAGKALEAVAEWIPEGQSRPGAVNLLGVTPLDYPLPETLQGLWDFIGASGFQKGACWAMGSTLRELAEYSRAGVNLVVSATGLPAARRLRHRFGTPYVTGVPVNGFTEILKKALGLALETGENQFPSRDCRTDPGSGPAPVAIGEPVLMGSLAGALEGETGVRFRVASPLEKTGDLLAPWDLGTDGEEEAGSALRGAALVMGDPMYRHVLEKGARLFSLPHQAFSGRNGWKTARDPLTLDLRDFLEGRDEP